MDSGGLTTDLQDRPGASQGASGAAGDVRDQAAQAAGVAADETKRVGSVAGQEAQKVAEESKQQVQQVFQDARGLLNDQATTQRDRLTEVLGSVGDDLERMGSEADGVAGDLVRQAAQQVRSISSKIEGKQPSDLLEDVKQFARQRPGTFLLGALVAGVAAGRLARGAQQAHSETPSTPSANANANVPVQRPTPVAPPSATVRTTPQSPAAATFPADGPGEI